MLKIKFITVGSLAERHWREACDEYKKRLSLTCKVEDCELKETKIAKNPTDGDIAKVLEDEADRILAQIPQRAYTVALCIEGKQLSSEELASLLDSKATEGYSDICFIIGSSHGLSDRVKKAANHRMSMSRLTFPHQLARVMLFEAVYRAGEINRGTKYHK
ncbi:MAG: 23S rRNA (pseudouridine(1915)-N(3))-methyltransferase RlmH [Ruminococcaceae bacterium]|nr:23S rRNA (pseudouridine(1915)-N(3))-methyltransferase RlmH [Oscillospiraceae bacterium]